MIKLSMKVLFLMATMGFSYAANADERSNVVMNERLKSAIVDNPKISSTMELFNFTTNSKGIIDIYQVTSDEARNFVPQEELAIMLYNKYIEKNYLPIVAILETNRQFLDAVKSIEN